MNNISVISVLFLSGLNETRNYKSALFFLSSLCYCLIILVNMSLILIIILNNGLHEPMYIMLCAFCINGLIGTTGFFPKLLWDLLSPIHVISYSGCLVQAYVIYFFASSEMSILSVMAYDRYLAICRPLEYHSVMSKQMVVKLMCFSWLASFCIVGVNIYLASRLKLCSFLIPRVFCVNWSIVALACFSSQTLVNGIVGNITIIIYVSHALLIIWSYAYLIKTCAKSIENRAKFMQTCVPHIVSLLIFNLAVLSDVTISRINSTGLPQSVENFVAMAFLVVPPITNPLVYGFKLTKVRKRIFKIVSLRMK